MSFTTPFFLFVFLPFSLLLYAFAGKGKSQTGCLCLISLLFYAFGQLSYIFLLLGSVVFNYAFGLLLSKKESKPLLVLAIAGNVGLLCVFKYGVELGLSSLTMPIGISVFTFQGISYVVDVYKDREYATKDFGKLFLYMAFFSRILAGPIEQYHIRITDVELHPLKTVELVSGIHRFIRGFAKKLLLAEPMACVCDTVLERFSSTGIGDFRLAWVFALSYMLQIYLDFSGYSDMAIGLGTMFGRSFTENFRHPYGAGSLKEFWRKWHISLSQWFLTYVYIPLGGNRKGKARAMVNRLIVFLLTGIWHGANLTYVFWGLGHGLLTSLEDLGVIPIKRLQESTLGRAALKVYTLLSVCLLFVVFRLETLTQGLGIIGAMFSSPASSSNNDFLAGILTPAFLFAALIGVLLSGNLPEKLKMKVKPGAKWEAAVSLILLFLGICAMAKGNSTPFIYAQF